MTKKIIEICVLVGIVFSVFFYLDSDHADAGEFKEFKQEYALDSAKDDYRDVKRQMWELEDKYGVDMDNAPEYYKKEYRELQDDRELLKDKIERLEGEL